MTRDTLVRPPGTVYLVLRSCIYGQLMANLLPQANSGLSTGSQGVYVGEGLPPVPTKLTAKIKWGKFIEMAKLLTEF